jgi:cyclic-di-GMP phosphodiesterase TipF (flagellum assembly factor)
MPGFVRAVGQFVEGHAELSGRLILGLSQRCWRSLDGERTAALAAMRDRGLTFMLDRAEDLRFDAADLAGCGVRYVKVSADALLEPRSVESGGAEPAGADLADLLSREGISLVVDRVEREGDVPDLMELGAAFAQGSAFAPPRAVRADALLPPASLPAEAQPVTDPPVAPATGGEAATETAERKPFRAFLRRAG